DDLTEGRRPPFLYFVERLRHRRWATLSLEATQGATIARASRGSRGGKEKHCRLQGRSIEVEARSAVRKDGPRRQGIGKQEWRRRRSERHRWSDGDEQHSTRSTRRRSVAECWDTAAFTARSAHPSQGMCTLHELSEIRGGIDRCLVERIGNGGGFWDSSPTPGLRARQLSARVRTKGLTQFA
ncbi:hypothetical protein BHM03_00057452, partial [Ensete ventricosum]